MKKVSIFSVAILLVFSLISANRVFAATQTIKIYANPGDGNVSTAPYPGSWSEQHNTSIGRVPVDTTTDFYIHSSIRDDQGYIEITRGFVSFDTSVIPDNANIVSAKLGLFNINTYDDFNDQYSYIGLFTGLQESITNLSTTDIDNCGNSINNPNFLASKKYLSDISLNQFSNFDLNPGGLSVVDKIGSTKFCLRSGADAENHELIKINPNMTWNSLSARFSSSETVGTDRDPYLEITYEVNDKIDRAAFIALVKEATKDEGRIVEKFFVAAGNRLFDFIEGGRTKLALLDLKVLSVLLNAKGIHNDALNVGISQLQIDLKE